VTSEDVSREVRALRGELRAAVADGKVAGEPDKAKRLSLSEILAAHLAAMNRSSSEHSSVRLARNARGDTQVEVVVRTGDSPDVSTVDECAAKAADVYDRLRLIYPMNAEPTRE